MCSKFLQKKARATLENVFQLFGATGKRIECLELLYKVLYTMKDSVENETVSSLSECIIIKIRNRLWDKSYFNNLFY